MHAIRKKLAFLLAGSILLSNNSLLLPCSAFQPLSQRLTTRTTRTTRIGNNNKRYIDNDNNNILTTRTTKFGGGGVRPLQAGLLGAAGSPVGSFLVLAGIIVVHECGHYFAARGFGITVEEFSIGFGPKLVGFSALGNEFNFRALPLGGYVRFPENYNTTLVMEQESELEEARRRRRKERRERDDSDDNNNNSNNDVSGKQQKKDSSSSVGFQILNAVTFGVLEKQRRKKQEEEEEERRQKLQEIEEEKRKAPFWKTMFSNNNDDNKRKNKKQATTTDDELPEEVEIEYYDDPNLLQNRPWFERAVVLSGGVVFNLLLAFMIYFGEITSSAGLPKPVFGPGALITQEPLAGGASVGVLHKGDVITKINGRDITQSQSPSAGASQKAISDFISTIRSTPDGESLQLSILKKNSKGVVDTINIQPRRSSSNGEMQSLGIMLQPNYVKTQIVKVENPIQGIKPAFDSLYETTIDTAGGILSALTKVLFEGSGKSGGQQISGPIGLIRTGSDVVKTQNIQSILLFAAAISVNLGVVNALPLPALDGGQLVFVLAEAVTGKKVDERLQQTITGLTLYLLLFLSASAAVGDVQSIFFGSR